jgi:hypothetical protein
MNELQPLAAEPVLQGFVWSWVVPALLFVVSFVATWRLYRHFSRDGD